ncbi:Bug family tripartite tricarboxylate transporter substrate binding protein [Rhodoplanes sp. SY1]|uniref:Bug family tripartite tricarboxylate transporter substrate binding protein n=1 Tax=Rhodoplanes sp. SY1 TaxID=3166646 RepID=UPI0038B69C93
MRLLRQLATIVAAATGPAVTSTVLTSTVVIGTVTIGTVLATVSGPAAAQSALQSTAKDAARDSWPDRPIRFLVTSAAGGGIDLMARLLAEGLSSELPQRVIVENNGSAGGLIATRTVAKAEPDGYTFLFTGPGMASLPYVYKTPGFDVRRDFESVSLVTRYPLVMVTTPDVPAKTLPEFIALVKKNPGKYAFGSSGIGGASHIPLEAFKASAGLDMVHVPYRGSGQTTAALLGGQIHLVIDGLAPQLPNIEDGRVRALAVTTTERSPKRPDLPTVAETLPGFAFPMWVAVFAPAKTPAAIVERMSKAIAAAVKSPAIAKRFDELVVDPVGSSPKELDRFLDEQLAFNKAAIEKAGISIQE